MARSASLLVACAVAVVAALSLGSLVVTFVGAASPASAGLRTSQRAPAVEMHFFGGPPVTTTPPPPVGGLGLDAASRGTYVVLMTILFFGSVVANGNGFFGGARRPCPVHASAETRASAGAMSGQLPDYDLEARKLFELLNLPASGAASAASSAAHRYRDLDAVWEHPRTGARVFIGNAYASKSLETLQKHGITRIVNCTSDMPNALQGSPGIEVYRFDIYKHMMALGPRRAVGGVLDFFSVVFEWIDEQVDAGRGVLIHCLAGAHRAGTTGVAYTMHAADLDHKTAIAACKACRPIVDPIGDLTSLLATLEREREAAKASAKAERAAEEPPDRAAAQAAGASGGGLGGGP